MYFRISCYQKKARAAKAATTHDAAIASDATARIVTYRRTAV
jgi:hypothetical protein